MKRKGIILLSSILAGSLLVGGAFATYAVTDNADPFGINVTPGDLETDDVEYFTLDWGQNVALTGIGNLERNEIRKAGTVSLKATPAYTGRFTVTLQDVTTAEKLPSDAKLLDNLSVYVYDGSEDLDNGALPTGEGHVQFSETITPTTAKGVNGKKKLTINVEGTPSGRELTIFVKLDTNDASVFEQLKNDKVYLEVDWMPQDGDEADEVVYFAKPSNWNNLRFYTWKEGGTPAAEWPGTEMVRAYDNIYQVALPKDYEGFILSGEVTTDNVTVREQTTNILLSAYTAAAPQYNLTTKDNEGKWLGSWSGKTPSTAASITATINGEGIALNDIKPAASENKAEYAIALEVGQKIEFKDNNTALNFVEFDKQQQTHVPLDPQHPAEFTATVAGIHNFYYKAGEGIYVGEPSSDPVPSAEYYLVGIVNGVNDWTTHEYPFALDNAELNEYKLEKVTLKAGDGIKVMSADGNTYYPDGSGNEFEVETDGDYTIYFRPNGNGNNDWHEGVFYVATYEAPQP